MHESTCILWVNLTLFSRKGTDRCDAAYLADGIAQVQKLCKTMAKCTIKCKAFFQPFYTECSEYAHSMGSQYATLSGICEGGH